MRGTAHGRRSSRGVAAGRQDPGQVAGDPAAGDVGARRAPRPAPAAIAASTGRRVEDRRARAARRPASGRRPAQAGPSRSRPARSSSTCRARRVAVGAQPRRGAGPTRTSPGRTRSGPSTVVALDDPDGEAGQVEVVGGHGPGVLGRLSAEQRAAGPPAPLGDPRHHLGHPVGVEAADGHVVEEEQRLGPAQTRSSTHMATRSMPTVS